jgi:signal transduction histidine kinase
VAVRALRLTADLQRSRERLVAAREEERRRLRRDLHDGFGPRLAGQAFKLEAARDAVADQPARAIALLDDMITKTQSMIAELRQLVYGLRPPALDELGLEAALREHALHSAPNGTAVSVVVSPAGGLPPLPAAVEVAAYRIAQEALNNVVRHAGASACAIRLEWAAAEAALWLQVDDDGQGLPAEARAGVGLSSMRERAEELGGTCQVAARPEGGTRVSARLPLPGAG